MRTAKSRDRSLKKVAKRSREDRREIEKEENKR